MSLYFDFSSFIVSKRCIPFDWGVLNESWPIKDAALLEPVQNIELLAKINGVGTEEKNPIVLSTDI